MGLNPNQEGGIIWCPSWGAVEYLFRIIDTYIRKETINEDADVILENIHSDGKLPVAHVTNGKSSEVGLLGSMEATLRLENWGVVY